jgi:hypothetical protein
MTRVGSGDAPVTSREPRSQSAHIIRQVVRKRPVIVAVDDHETEREQLRLELERRYDRDYDIVVESSPSAALAAVETA